MTRKRFYLQKIKRPSMRAKDCTQADVNAFKRLIPLDKGDNDAGGNNRTTV